MSIEQRIFEAKNSYYQSLYESQRGWHTDEHTILPWTTFLIQILDGAYQDFERRVAAAGADKGSKQDRPRRSSHFGGGLGLEEAVRGAADIHGVEN